jgi:transcriptional regulator with XRE-family HTH domain
MYDFGLRLKEIREARNLSQNQVAYRLKISKSSISGYENNTRYPSLDVLIQLALLFKVSSDYILGLDNRKMVNVDGLSDRHIDFINSLIIEFRLCGMKGDKINI